MPMSAAVLLFVLRTHANGVCAILSLIRLNQGHFPLISSAKMRAWSLTRIID